MKMQGMKMQGMKMQGMKMQGMKKVAAAAMIGLTAFGAIAIAPSSAQAQDAPTEQTPDATRAERQANREARKAERIAILTDALGVDQDVLAAARQAGQSIAEVASDQGVAIETVVDALVAQKTASIQERVAAGDLTQDEANERIAGLEERVTERVNATPGERGEGRRGHRGPRGNNATAEGPTT